jgi:protein TonB
MAQRAPAPPTLRRDRALVSTALSLAGHGILLAIFTLTASQKLAAPKGGERPLEVQIVAGAQESAAARAAANFGEPIAEAPDEAPLASAPVVEAAPDAIAAPRRMSAPQKIERREARPHTDERAHARALAKGAPQAHRREPAAAEGDGRERLHSLASTRGGEAGGSTFAGTASSASYRATALAHLARFKRYPNEARDRNIVGVAVVRFTLSPGGAVLAVALARSSGAPMLDEAALAMVRRAAPFPPMSDGASSMTIAAGVDYNLK